MKYEKTLIDIKTDIVSSDTMYSLILINADALTLALNGVRCYLTGRFLLCLSVEDTVSVHGGQYEAVNLQFLPFFYNVNLNHEIIGMPMYEEMRARHGYPDFHLFRTRNDDYIGILHLSDDEYDMAQTYFKRAKRHIDAHDTDVMWSCNTRSDLISILQTAESAHSAPGDLKENEILRYIRENPEKDLSLAALSRHFHTNRTTLTETIKSLTGMTPTQYVLETRLSLSCPDLLFTSVPIQTVAEKYGFEDPNYYIRAFKKRFGQSPLQYRKESYDNRLRHENAYRALAERVREFEGYVKGGLGRAVLMLRKEEEKSSFRKVLVDFLLGNEKYVRTYGFYEKTLIEAFPDSEVLARKIAEGLLARIKEGKCFFALPLLSELGYKEDALAHLEGEYAQAYAILVERLKNGNDSEDTDAVATRYASAARALGQYAQYTDCDDDRLFRILSDMADLYKYSEHPPVPEKNNPIFSMVAGIGKARFLPLLRRVEAEHPFGKKLDVHKDFAGKKSIDPPITAEDILSCEGFFDTEYPALFDAFAASPQWVHMEIARAALDEADPKRKAYLLSFFASTAHPHGHPVFPLDPDPLIREAERILENCQSKLTYEETCFFEVLYCVHHSAVRTLGEKLLQRAETSPNEPNAHYFKSRGIGMCFLSNYTLSDRVRFSEILLSNTSNAEQFEIFAELIRKKTPGLPKELVPYALHNTSVYGIRPQLAEALAESGMMTEDILEECRYDACERTRRAVDTHKVKKELLQFETDYKRGHGRAILTVRDAEDKEPYKNRIVSLLTNNSVIPRPFGTYDRDLIECFPDSDKVLSEIVETLLKKFSDKNILPYLPGSCAEISLLGTLGYTEKITDILHTHYEKAYADLIEYIKTDNSNQGALPVSAYFGLLCAFMRGLHADRAVAKKLLLDMAELYAYSDAPILPHKHDIVNIFPFLGEEELDTLFTEVAEEHRFGEKLRKCTAKRALRPQAEPNISTEEFLSSYDRSQQPGSNPNEFLKLVFSLPEASEETVCTVAQAALDNLESEKGLYYLSLFGPLHITPLETRGARFPLDVTPILEKVEAMEIIAEGMYGSNPKYWLLVKLCSFLSVVTHPKVKNLGKKILLDEKADSLLKEQACRMVWSANFEPDDTQDIIAFLKLSHKTGDESLCTACLRCLSEQMKKNNVRLAPALVKDIFYMADYHIRPTVVEAILASGSRIDDILEDCRRDAHEKIREMAAQADAEAVSDKACEFAEDISKGLGRALMTLRKAKDKAPYRETVLDYLTKTDSFERARTVYDAELIDCFSDRDTLRREIADMWLKYFSLPDALLFLPRSEGAIHLLYLLGYGEEIQKILREYYDVAYAQLIDYIKTENADKNVPCVRMYAAIISGILRQLPIDLKVTKNILLDIAELFTYDDAPVVPCEFNALNRFHIVPAEQMTDLLAEVAREHKHGSKLHIPRLQLPKADPNITAEEIFTAVEAGTLGPLDRANVSFSQASEQVIHAVAEAALSDLDSVKALSYLSLFNGTPHLIPSTPFPLDVTPIIQKAKSLEIVTDTDETHKTYMQLANFYTFLKSIKHPDVKALGKEILAHPQADYYLRSMAFPMIYAANFAPEDTKSFASFLKTDLPDYKQLAVDTLITLLEKEPQSVPAELIGCAFDAATISQRRLLVKAMLAGGRMTDEIREECRYDANEAIRTMIAQADAEAVGDKACEFAEDISKGLGRAILTVCKAENKAPYRKVLVDFIKNREKLTSRWISPSYDEYLFELICRFPDSDCIIAEITPHLLSHLKEGFKLVSLPLLLRLGYEKEVRALMDEMYKTAYDGLVKYEKAGADGDVSPLEELFTCAATSQVRELNGGEARAKEILLDIADLYDYTDTPYLSVRFNPIAGFVSDEAMRRLFEQIVAEHRNGQKLLAHNTTVTQDPSLTPAKENLTLADLLTVKQANAESYYAVSKAFLDAPDSLVRAFAEEIVKEKDPKKLGDLLYPFNFGIRTSRVDKKKAPVFPLDPTPLIEIAEQNTATDPKTGFLPPEIAEFYIFLAHLRHPAVRAWGERLYAAGGKNLCSYAVIAFENNYVPKDGAYLERMAKEAPDPLRNFWRQTAERLIAAEAKGLSEELMRYCFYNTANCYSRLRIVHAWLKRGTMPADVREDCLYAGYDEIRRLVKEGHRDTADFITFEREVIHRIFKEVPEYEENLCRQYRSVVVADRKFTGHGFCTTFYGVTVPYSLGKDVNLTLGKVSATLNDRKHGAGFTLFVRDGVISCLEGYAYGEPWPEKIEKYTFDEAEKTEQEL